MARQGRNQLVLTNPDKKTLPLVAYFEEIASILETNGIARNNHDIVPC